MAAEPRPLRFERQLSSAPSPPRRRGPLADRHFCPFAMSGGAFLVLLRLRRGFFLARRREGPFIRRVRRTARLCGRYLQVGQFFRPFTQKVLNLPPKCGMLFSSNAERATPATARAENNSIRSTTCQDQNFGRALPPSARPFSPFLWAERRSRGSTRAPSTTF